MIHGSGVRFGGIWEFLLHAGSQGYTRQGDGMFYLTGDISTS